MKFFCRGTPKNAEKGYFLHSGNLLEFLVLVPKSGGPPLESSRSEVSENVVVYGCGSLQRGVIGCQSQQTLKFWVCYKKYEALQKKQHSVNNDRTDLKRIGVVVHPMPHPIHAGSENAFLTEC